MQLTKTNIALLDNRVNNGGLLIKISDPFSFEAFEGAFQRFYDTGFYDIRCYLNAKSYACIRIHKRDILDFFSSGSDLKESFDFSVSGDVHLKKSLGCTSPNTENRINISREMQVEQLYVVGKTGTDMVFVSKVLFDYRRMQDAQQKKW